MQSKFFFIFYLILFPFDTSISYSQQKDIYNFSANKITYSQDNNIIEALGNVVAKNNEGKQISSDKIIYNRAKQHLSTFGNSTFTDNKIGTLYAERFEYNLDKQSITAEEKVKFVDKDKNTYYFSKLNSDDKFKEIIGTDINVELNKEALKSGDKFNEFIEPRFSGKSATLRNNITIVQDAKFTTCKKSNETSGCTYWNLEAGQLIHDKEQKKLTYKNALLDLNSIPVIYVPYFSHPDPTVKRKEGFLAPSFTSLGDNLGSTIKIPYFYPLSESADFTLNPVYYFKQHPLLLGEYRERFKNGDFVIEGGYTQGYQKITSTQTGGSRNHLYGNINLNFKDKILDESQFSTKIQRVSDPTYLRVNKINSTNDGFKKNLVRENDTKLTNEVSLNSFGKNETLNLKATAYQNITTIKKSDQYEYVAPEIIYSKYNFLNNNLNLNSSFRSLNTNTNQNKTSFTNNIDHSTSESYNSNLGIGYKFLTKINNINYYADHKNPKENLNSQINPIVALDTSLPLGKISKESEQYIIPRILTRYAPGKMQNAKSNDITLNTDNLFSINRMNSDDLIEKDFSLNIGLDWLWKEKKLDQTKPSEAGLSVGQVIKFNNDLDMPTKSSLQNKNSDLVTKTTYLSPGNFDFTMKNTLDNNLNHAYYNDVTLKTFLRQGEVNFNFYEKNSHIGSERFAKANLSSFITDGTKIKIETDRNLKTDMTNSHKLGIENENECIRYGIYFQRNYASDKDLKPATSIFFGITLLPFGDK
ncbi:LPS-assembly protein LptD [Candidatus Fonsibacter ubiquis]|uniref:LPS-assembly protein LptD n=1 Tax=Candidatus Fonsibacter ubiquis TaxID=1925548 RepID=UPI000C070F01|nr:LPS export ABC transporter periplasmic protein LptC [Candidatus Fonsibacter ubiquis]